MLRNVFILVLLLSAAGVAKAEQSIFGPFPPGYYGSPQHIQNRDAHMRAQGFLPTPGVPNDYFKPIPGYDYTKEPGFRGVDYGGKYGVYGGGLFQQGGPATLGNPGYYETRPPAKMIPPPPMTTQPAPAKPPVVDPQTPPASDTFPAPKKLAPQKPSTDPDTFPAPVRPAEQQKK